MRALQTLWFLINGRELLPESLAEYYTHWRRQGICPNDGGRCCLPLVDAYHDAPDDFGLLQLLG